MTGLKTKARPARLLAAAPIAMLAGLLATAAPASAADQKSCTLGVMADLPVTMDGLRASVPVMVNGQKTSFWLDSGAFYSLMPEAKAIELGLRRQMLPPGFYVSGIGGDITMKVTTIKSFKLVGQELKNLNFLVGGSDGGNGFIGRNILALADTEFDLAHGMVKIIRPRGACGGTTVAYWAKDQSLFATELYPGTDTYDSLFDLPVSINGKEIRATLDSGAAMTIITRAAAEKAGIDLSAPSARPISGIGGIGQRYRNGWIVPVQSVAIGAEQILRTHLYVIDGDMGSGPDAPDMLLGADFMMAHRIYVARGQKRIYFTYAGGKPFLTPTPEQEGEEGKGDRTGEAANKAPLALPEGLRRVQPVANAGDKPESADAFARRGNASLSRKAYADAIRDLTSAIRLAPEGDPALAEYYASRADAYDLSDQETLARADIDKALTLAPDHADLRRTRAILRLHADDRAGALADAEAAAKATPPTSMDMADVAMLFERLRQPDRSVALLDPVIAAHKWDAALPDLLNSRCWVRALANVELDKAMKDCNAALRRTKGRSSILDSRGLVQFRMGNFAEAIADYDAALALEPDSAWSLYMRGLAKEKLGQAAAGKADREAALAIAPTLAREIRDYGLDPRLTEKDVTGSKGGGKSPPEKASDGKAEDASAGKEKTGTEATNRSPSR